MEAQELIFFQFGHVANIVGNHFWTLQQKLLNEDKNTSPQVLWRQGAETAYPRVLKFDFHDGFYPTKNKMINQKSKEATQEVHSWDQEKVVESNTEDEENAVNSYFRPCGLTFHSRSKEEISLATHWNTFCEDSSSVLDGFDYFDENERKHIEPEVIETNFRYFAEECDRLQGFVVLMDTQSAFCGYATKLLHFIEDEHPKASKTFFSITPKKPTGGFSSLQFQKFVQNDIIANYYSTTLSNSHYVPIEIPNYFPCQTDLNWNDDEFWINVFDNSALIASAISTLSLPWQSGQNLIKLWQLHQSLSPYSSSKISFLNSSLPNFDSNSQLWHTFEGLGDLKPYKKTPEFLHALTNSIYSFYNIEGTQRDKLHIKCNQVVMQGLDSLTKSMCSKKGATDFSEKTSQYLSYRLPEFTSSIPKTTLTSTYGHGLHLVPPFPGSFPKATFAAPVVENTKEEVTEDHQKETKETETTQEIKISKQKFEPKEIPYVAQLFTPAETQVYIRNARLNLEHSFKKTNWNSVVKELQWEDIMEQYFTIEEDYQQ